MQNLNLSIHNEKPLLFTPQSCIIAGWTGRDRKAIDHHIAELAELGVTPPSSVPLYYRAASQQVTASEIIEAVGTETSGEAEPVLFDDGMNLYLGLGSDHTDRALETHSVALSKQICAKPIATTVWKFDQVSDHLDALLLKSYIRNDVNEDWTLYQDGTLESIRPLQDLIAGSPLAVGQDRLQSGTIMFCGTLGAIGGVRPARFIKLELVDPVLKRNISFAYETKTLPNIS